jgi:hypothetical protein
MKKLFVIFKQQFAVGTKEEYSLVFNVDLSSISIEEFIKQYQYNDAISLIEYKRKEVK